MIHQRITTALLILEIAVVAVLLGATVSRAFSLGDIGVTVPQSLDVQVISEQRGLNGTKYSQCTGDVFALFRDNLDDQVRQWVEDTAKALLQSMTQQLQTRLWCSISNGIGKLTTLGFGNGGRFGGAAPECNFVQGSDMGEILKQQLQNRLTQNFLVSCTSYMMSDAVSQTIAAMVQTQGPDGGPAWATDWVQSQNVRPSEQAQRRFWTQLANTEICPQFRDEVLNYFSVPQSYRDTPPAISSLGLRVNELAPFELRGRCSLPAGYNPNDSSEEAFVANGGWEFLPTLTEPQNNLAGFISMAEAEYNSQREAMLQAAENQLIAGGGFLPVYGDRTEGCALDPEGKCITDGSIRQPPGAVRDIIKSDLEGQYDQLADASGEEGLMDDVGSRIQVRLLGLANAPLPLNIQLGPEKNPANFTPRPPTPLPPGSSPTPDPNDPACTGGDPRCSCVKGDPTYEAIASGTIANSIAAAMEIYPYLFIAGTNQIVPGQERAVLDAMCERIGGGLCHPHPSQNDEVVLDFGAANVSFDVITADGYVRTNGGSPVALCEAGVQ